MYIPCPLIRTELTSYLQKKSLTLARQGKHPKLLAILLGDNPDQLSYVHIKRHLAEMIGVEFEFLKVPEDTTPSEFEKMILQRIHEKEITGIIIQQPMPSQFDVHRIYDLVPPEKEIEGHTLKSSFVFPLVQACMIGLDWAYMFETKHREPDIRGLSLPFVPSNSMLDWLKKKNITIAGKGETTGAKISHFFQAHGIPYHQTDSRTQNSDDIYVRSDIIITGVGKKILSRHNIKRGAVLLNFGLRKEIGEDGRPHLRGDYDEADVKDIAQLYTKTPNGLGPIDVLCLYGNLLSSN